MTRREAWLEEEHLMHDHIYRWPLWVENTPYVSYLWGRHCDLFNWYHSNLGKEPISHEEWLKKLPPKDVEETVENWFKNQYSRAKDKNAWRRKMEEAGNKVPPVDETIPDYLIKDEQEYGESGDGDLSGLFFMR